MGTHFFIKSKLIRRSMTILSMSKMKNLIRVRQDMIIELGTIINILEGLSAFFVLILDLD